MATMASTLLKLDGMISVFTHGLASLTAMGLLDVSEESAKRMLREAERHYALLGE